MDSDKSERFINDSMLSIIQTILSDLSSAYRKHYNANHVLIGVTKNWKKNPDNKKLVTVFMDFIKSF